LVQSLAVPTPALPPPTTITSKSSPSMLGLLIVSHLDEKDQYLVRQYDSYKACCVPIHSNTTTVPCTGLSMWLTGFANGAIASFNMIQDSFLCPAGFATCCEPCTL
jgi:hypothetical protein